MPSGPTTSCCARARCHATRRFASGWRWRPLPASPPSRCGRATIERAIADGFTDADIRAAASLPSVATGTASITAKALSATLTGVSKVYDGGTAAVLNGANYQLTGLVGGESASVSQTAGLYNSADVLGANSVSASLSGANFTAGASTSLANYSLPTVATGSASITAKPLSASLTGTISKTYDGGNSALLGAGNFSLSGFVGTQSASVTHTSGRLQRRQCGHGQQRHGQPVGRRLYRRRGHHAVQLQPANRRHRQRQHHGQGPWRQPDGRAGPQLRRHGQASLTGSNFVLGGLVAGESINVGTLNGSYDSRNAGTRTVSATLAGGDFTAGSGTRAGQLRAADQRCRQRPSSRQKPSR